MSTHIVPITASEAAVFQDFVLPNEQIEYSQTRTSLMAELNSQGILEQIFADEIMGANWRLRRCRFDEAGLAKLISQTGAVQDSIMERKQKSIERSRAAAQLALRRSIAELRKLQTERAVRADLDITDLPALADTAHVFRAARLAAPAPAETPQPDAPPQRRRLTMEDLENLMAQADRQLGAQVRADYPSSFCKTAAADSLPAPEERAAIRREACETLELLRKARNRAA